MKGITLKHWLAGAIMLAAAAAAVVLKPTIRIAEQHPINLEQMIPQQFGDWTLDQSVTPVQADPEVQSRLNKIYSHLLSRTYINTKGERVMLSIAYGSDQSDAHQVHRPEVCYPAQGMPVQSNERVLFDSGFGKVPAKKLVARRREGVFEPILYWVTVGDKAVSTGNQQKLEQLHYGLKRQIPDGLIFRVSEVTSDPANDKLLTIFVRNLLGSMDVAARKRLGLST